MGEEIEREEEEEEESVLSGKVEGSFWMRKSYSWVTRMSK